MAKVKYLQIFENAQKLDFPTVMENGQPWVGAEVATKKVRYVKTGVMGMEITTPDINEGEAQQ